MKGMTRWFFKAPSGSMVTPLEEEGPQGRKEMLFISLCSQLLNLGLVWD